MRMFFLLVKLIALFILCVGVSQAVVESYDALGNKVVLKNKAQRIISLAPHTTELLFSAGAKQQVIATVEYSDFPIEAKQLPRIGSYNRLDIEAIISLKPDLIVAWKSGNPNDQIVKLQQLGLNVYYSEPRSLDNIAEEIISLSKLMGTEKMAIKVAEKFETDLRQLKKRYSHKIPVKVFYQVWNQPLMTINGEHLISHVMELCSGKNVFSELNILAPEVNIEAVIQAAPEVIVAGVNKQRSKWVSDWKKWNVIPAVKNKQIYGINADLIVRHTVRILLGAKKMCIYIDEARQQYRD